MARLLALALAFAAIATAGCSRASDETAAKKWPDQAPPEDVTPPADLTIEVTSLGAPQSPITAATLTAHKADFADADRSAWLIATLVPSAAPAGSVVEAIATTGVSVRFERPASTGLEPVLFLTRRGDVLVSAIDPKDPFPRYHGQGGRLHRAGDATPRVSPVKRIVITHAPSAQ